MIVDTTVWTNHDLITCWLFSAYSLKKFPQPPSPFSQKRKAECSKINPACHMALRRLTECFEFKNALPHGLVFTFVWVHWVHVKTYICMAKCGKEVNESNYYDSILLVYGSSQRLNRIFSDCSNCDHFLSKRELQKGLEKHVRYIWVCLLCEWGINLDVLDISSWVRVLFGQFQALWLAAWFIQARHTLVGLRSESGKWDSTWLPKLVWSGTS